MSLGNYPFEEQILAVRGCGEPALISRLSAPRKKVQPTLLGEFVPRIFWFSGIGNLPPPHSV